MHSDILKEKTALDAKMYLCTPTVKLFYENVTCVTADFEILQHLNLNIFQCIDFFLSRNLKNDPPKFNFHP